MAWRPRKSIRLGKGFRINLSRKGVGWSSGLPGIFRFGVGSDGRRRGSVGKGLFRQEKQWGKSKGDEEGGGCCGCIGLIIIAFLILGIIGMFVSPDTDITEVPPDSAAHTPQSDPVTPTVVEEPEPVLESDDSSPLLPIPTPTQTWRSADGRTLLGRVVALDLDSQTIAIIRADGTRFEDFPLSNLHPDDAAQLVNRPAEQGADDQLPARDESKAE